MQGTKILREIESVITDSGKIQSILDLLFNSISPGSVRNAIRTFHDRSSVVHWLVMFKIMEKLSFQSLGNKITTWGNLYKKSP